MNDALVQLAERCEAATGPDRELDLAIHRLIDPEHVGHMDREYERLTAEITAMGPEAMKHRLPWLGGHVYTSPRYTARLDAAMTLVPPEHAVDLTIWAGKNRARLLHIFQDGDRWLHSGSAPHYCPDAATPALALTAAALRALAKEPTP